MSAILKIVKTPILRWMNTRMPGFAYWWFRGIVRHGRSTTTYNCSVIVGQIGRQTGDGLDVLSHGGDSADSVQIRVVCENWRGEWCPVPEAREMGGYERKKITHVDFGYWWFLGRVRTDYYTVADYSDGLVVRVCPGAPHVQGIGVDGTIDRWDGVWCRIPEPVE